MCVLSSARAIDSFERPIQWRVPINSVKNTVLRIMSMHGGLKDMSRPPAIHEQENEKEASFDEEFFFLDTFVKNQFIITQTATKVGTRLLITGFVQQAGEIKVKPKI